LGQLISFDEVEDMGEFTAGTGTVYRSLYESARKAFGAGTQMLEQLPCYGDPVGWHVRCSAKIGDFDLWIETPQSYGERDYLAGRTAGVLRVSRVVDANTPDLAWIEPARIAEAFSIQPILDIFAKQPQIESISKRVERAEHNLSMCIRRPWLSQITDKSPIAAMPEGWIDNRSAVLFSNRNQRMFACEVKGPSDGALIQCPYGFPCRIKLRADQRWEFFLYEFQLSGRNSWEFDVESREWPLPNDLRSGMS
jgi:hypothetical protein